MTTNQVTRPDAPATQRQIDFIRRLLNERDLMSSPRHFDACNSMDADEYRQHLADLAARAAYCTRGQASKWIDRLIALPHKDSPPDPGPSAPPVGEPVAPTFAVEYRESSPGEWYPVLTGGDNELPRGSYAIDTDDPINPVKFYRVWIGDHGHPRYHGKWNVRVQHGPEESSLRSKRSQVEVALKIAENPNAAATKYGHEIGRCGICGRRLTRQESRDRGIGPVCAERFGW